MPETLDDADEARFDQELTRLALAADPDMAVPADAVPIWQVLGVDGADGSDGGALLPSWYMPAPSGGARRRQWSRRKRIVVLLVILAFLVIDAYGFCSTYGQITIA